jgi:hypothetical protein
MTTEERINRTYRANHRPADASMQDIAAALEGRKLYNPDLMQNVEPYCSRCSDKNRKRRLVRIDDTDPYIQDGDRVAFFAISNDPDDLTTRKHWRVLSVLHERHPQPPMSKIEDSRTDIVRAWGRVHKTEYHEHLVDVDVIERSPVGDGPAQSVIQKRRKECIDHSAEVPDGITVLDVAPEDPFPNWPEADRQWLRELIVEHGPLESDTEYPEPTFGYGTDDADDDDDDDGGVVITP